MFSRRNLSKRPTRSTRKSKTAQAQVLRAAVEALEVRRLFAFFSVGTESAVRNAIMTANTNSDTVNIFSLTANIALTTANSAGQENLSAEGDLDLNNQNSGSVPLKKYVFQGHGFGLTQTVDDRVVQAIGSDVSVQFVQITLTGGKAIDDGSTGAVQGDTEARGGAVLSDGGNVSFTSSFVNNNQADGANAQSGNNLSFDGISAKGGGLYSSGGTVTIVNSDFTSNLAKGGTGANGTNATNGDPGGNGGVAGSGGNAAGGAVYMEKGKFIETSSGVTSNAAIAGNGGGGGKGGDAASSHTDGGKGGRGGDGGSASGGGIFVGTGAVTLNNASLDKNKADAGTGGVGGKGGKGGSSSGGTGGNGGDGGTGGDVKGGGIYLQSGDVLITTSFVNSNRATFGQGGNGGDGGTNGDLAGNGGNGGNGGVAQGGGIYAGGGNVSVTGDTSGPRKATVNNNSAVAGNGGLGGIGASGASNSGSGDGGRGGNGGVGGEADGGGIYAVHGEVTLSHSAQVNTNQASGGASANGGKGGKGQQTGGAGGSGGAGGNALGGGIYAALGDIVVNDLASVDKNKALAGIGGFGADAGPGASPTGGTAPGGNGAAGGAATGGGIYTGDGKVTIDDHSTVNSNLAQGGSGADGGKASDTGPGGSGGTGGGAFGGGIYTNKGDVKVDTSSHVNNNKATAGNGGQGGNGTTGGGKGGNGGDAGEARAGGIADNLGSVTVDNLSTVNSNKATSGPGGIGGNGGNNAGGQGGDAGNGGGGASAVGGGVYANMGDVTVDHSSSVNSNHVTAGNGAVGGIGGTGTVAGNGGVAGTGGSTVGGGIWVQIGNVLIDNGSTFDNNQLVASTGGGVLASGIGAFTGDVTIRADILNITANDTIFAGDTVTLVPVTPGRMIDLGSLVDTTPNTLELSDAELDRVTTSTLQIGDTMTGPITFTAAITRSAPTVVKVTAGSGNNIAFSGAGSLDSDGGDVTLTTSGTGAITSGTAAADITAVGAMISLNAGSGGIGAGGNPLVISAADLNTTTSGNGNQYLSALTPVTVTSMNAGTGTIFLAGGTFTLDGTITGNVNNSGTFLGTGTVTGNVSGTGTFSPGDAPGIMTINGNFTPSGTVNFEVNSPYATPGTDYDQYIVSGLVNLSGSTLTFTNNIAGPLPALVTLIKHGAGGGATTAGSPANGSPVTFGASTARLLYNGGDGNDVVLARSVITTAGGTTLSGTEGRVLTGTVATFTDSYTAAPASDFTATVNWGDGNSTAGIVFRDSTGHYHVGASHAYAEQSAGYTVKVTINDIAGPSKTVSGTAKIADAPLDSAAGLSLKASKNTTFTNLTLGSFRDQDSLNTLGSDYIGTIDWGDGSAKTAAKIVFNGSTFNVGSFWKVQGTHKYTKAGTFTVKITVKDAGPLTITAVIKVT